MKQITGIIAALIITVLIFPSCEEVGPFINLEDDTFVDSTFIDNNLPTAQGKAVVIEEYTGVNCINCPEGHELVEGLKSTHGDRLIPIALHPNDGNPLTRPFSGLSVDDLRTEEAATIAGLYRYPSLPSAMVDRKDFVGSGMHAYGRNNWSGYVDQRMTETTPVNITMEASLKEGKTYNVVVKLHYLQAISDPSRLSVVITEDNITTAQLKHKDPPPGDERDANYTHEHVLRTFVSSTTGDKLDVTLEAGRVVWRSFEITLEDAWDPAHIDIVAFVHQFENDAVIYHAAKLDLP